MPIARPTLAQLYAAAQSDIATRIDGSTPQMRRSLLGAIAAAVAGAVHSLYGYLIERGRQSIASTATGVDLDSIAGLWSIMRKQATQAAGSVLATGAPGRPVPISTAITSDAGVQYFTTAAAVLDATGAATITVTAIDAGAAGNQAAGALLAFVNPPAGVNSAVTVATGGLLAGADIETDDALRARLVARLASAPHGGNAADYVAWALAVPPVDRAWCFPTYAGPGSVRVYVADDQYVGATLASAATVAAVQAAIEAVRPLGVVVLNSSNQPVSGVSVVAPTLAPQNYTLAVQPNTPAVQAAVTAALQALYYTAAPEGSIKLHQIYKAILDAPGLVDYTLTAPTADATAAAGQILSLGTITWQ